MFLINILYICTINNKQIEIMKAQFLVLTLEETEVVTRVTLTEEEGLETETKHVLTSTLEGSFETELEALKRVEEILETFRGEVEIKKVFI